MKRLNIKLTLWLIGIVVISVVGVHFLHGYQLGRNADFLRVQAENARENGNVREAMKQYNQYLKHRDDPAGYSALAEIVIEIAKDKDATRPDKIRAYNILEEAIRRHPDLDEVRRSLIDYTIQARRFGDALEHIQYLTDKGKKDAELDLKIAICHYQNGEEEKALKQLCDLLGYDLQTGGFAAEAPPGAKELPAFELLAHILRSKNDGPALANKVMAQMVVWNPDSAKAHLSRAGFLINSSEFKVPSQEFQDAKPELERAIELEPENVDVLVTSAIYAMSLGGFAQSQQDAATVEREFAKAQEYLDKALKLDPERQDIYLRMAQLSLSRGDVKKAVEQLTEGLAKASDVNTIVERLIDMRFQTKDLDAVRALVKQMRERNTFTSEMIRFQEARIKFAENNFQEASREFEAVRPILARFGKSGYALQLDLMLGRCYEVLNQPDRQLEVYRRVLLASPTQTGARLGEATALQSLGRHAEAAASIKLLADNAEKLPFLQTTVIYMLINEQLQLPEEQRDWTQVDKIAEMIYADKARTELANDLLKSELLMLKNQFDDAQKLLLETQKKNPKEARVWMTLAKLMGRNEKTRARLPQLLTRIEKEVGDIAALRAERIKLAMEMEPEKSVAELRKLEQGLDAYTEGERLSLMLTLGSAYLHARSLEDAKRCWNYAITKDPKNAVIRQSLFDLAIDTKDEATVKAILTDLRESPHFGPQNPLYKYCTAAEMLSRVNKQREGKTGAFSAADQKTLTDARKLVDEGIAMRGEWSVLWRLRGEIDQLEGNYPSAIENYQRSLDYSRAGQSATVRRLISLLYATNRIEDANEALKYLGETAATDPLRKVVSDIKEKTGNIDDALEMAKKDVEAQPESPQNHLWYGQFLVRAGRTDDAEIEFRKAVELGPKIEESWELLVRHLMAAKKKNEAVEAVRDASKQLADHPVALARLYERVEDHEQAEHYYKAAVEADPNNLLAVRRIVEYYLGTNQIAKAVPFLDQIIQKTAKSAEKSDRDQLAWARRNKAQVVASAGDYEHVMQAVRLIEQNVQEDGRLAPDDALAIFQLLSRRQEPESRDKAAKLMTKLQETRPLLPREQTALAMLYATSGKWTQARDLMLAAISRRSDDPEILVNFANMLVNHEEFDDAERWVERLEEMIKPPATAPEQIKTATRQLRARLLIHKGQKEQAVAALESLVPGPLPQNQLFRLELVSKMMESMGLLEGAERLLNDYMSQEPRGAIAMASFVGRRGDVDKAFTLLEEARKNQPVTEILPVALEALRLHRDKASKEKYKLLEEWIQAGLQDEANAQHIKMLLAEVYDLQGRYADVIKTYKEVLANKDITIYQRAQVQNNLAFILALSKENAPEALKMTNESMQVLGPISDLLDTRALAYLAAGKPKEAIADLQTAIADAPSGGKYFHLALAEQQAGNLEGARAALAKSEELGATVNQLTELEKKSYNELVAALK